MGSSDWGSLSWDQNWYCCSVRMQWLLAVFNCVDSLWQWTPELPEVTRTTKSEGKDQEEARTEAGEFVANCTATPGDECCCSDDAATSSTHITSSDSTSAVGTGFHGIANCWHEWRYSNGCRHASRNDGHVTTLFTGYNSAYPNLCDSVNNAVHLCEARMWWTVTVFLFRDLKNASQL